MNGDGKKININRLIAVYSRKEDAIKFGTGDWGLGFRDFK
jgi:hypothetical protein